MKKWFLKIEQVLLFSFLLLIPTQLGKHFWPEWSYVLGLRIDYLSPTFYLLDLIWIGLFIVESRKLKVKSFKWNNLIWVIFIGVNILVAGNHWVAGYRWIRIIQVIWTIWYLRRGRHNGLPLQNYLKTIIPCWIILEGFLGWAQVVNSGSLNGLFYFLGERNFNFNTIGIAQMSFLGEGFVRAYGTFSHPNSLGGFLLVSLILWMMYKPSVLQSRTSPLTGRLLRKTLWWVVTWSGILGIIISGSRVVIVFSILYLVFSIRKKIKIGGVLVVLGFLLIIGGVLGSKNILGGWDKESFSKRMELNLVAMKMFKETPLFGVGAGNFLVKLPEYEENNGLRWIQPVHNVPLLILSEIGMVGILIFNFQFSIFKTLCHFVTSPLTGRLLKLVWGVILVTGLFDHYWLTLPQNWWLLGVIISLGEHRDSPVQNLSVSLRSTSPFKKGRSH